MADRISGLQLKELGAERFTRYEERFQIPLALAVACFLIEGILSERSRGRREWRGRFGVRALALVLLLAASAAQARSIGDRAVSRNEAARALYEAGRYEEALQMYKEALVERPESARLHLNVGDAQFRLGDFERALREFERVAAADDPALSASGHYNKGNTHFQLQDYPAAAEAYRQALQRVPGDADAKANLELALQRLPPPQPQGGENQEDPPDGGEQDSPDGDQRDPPEGEEQQQQRPSSSPEPDEGPPEPDDEDGEAQAPPPAEEGGLDREEAERLLDALRDREQEAQERRYRARGGGDEARDW